VSRRRPLCAVLVAGVALCTLVVPATPALGDADPASDVLLGENVFYPYDPPVSSHLQAELNQETAAAHRGHFALKVALIDTPVDLGAIPSFFEKPKQYAAFLDQEISFAGKVPLLVVMPNGYGAADMSSTGETIVASLPPPAGHTSNALAEAAIAGVRKLSNAARHPVNASGAGASTSGRSVALPLVILAAVCVLIAGAIIALRSGWPRALARRR
jgi:hypothetical protein